MKEVKRLENVSLGDQSLIALTALRRRTSGDLGRGECPIPRKPGKKIKLISLCRGRPEKKHFEINDFLNFIVAHSFSINCRGSESNWILRRAFIVCDVQDQDFYIANFDK
ncbi:unnamed protein product [Danaus chrysippus]|uniref:(African queen) hypothetical protein n=1 Tax=Danaus chrysippus TaxID=151541 RepID=A0A8J2WDQ8_9NEOP|nr:unnamed protein product [Danaus chrysippus]